MTIYHVGPFPGDLEAVMQGRYKPRMRPTRHGWVCYGLGRCIEAKSALIAWEAWISAVVAGW